MYSREEKGAMTLAYPYVSYLLIIVCTPHILGTLPQHFRTPSDIDAYEEFMNILSIFWENTNYKTLLAPERLRSSLVNYFMDLALRHETYQSGEIQGFEAANAMQCSGKEKEQDGEEIRAKDSISAQPGGIEERPCYFQEQGQDQNSEAACIT